MFNSYEYFKQHYNILVLKGKKFLRLVREFISLMHLRSAQLLSVSGSIKT